MIRRYRGGVPHHADPTTLAPPSRSPMVRLELRRLWLLCAISSFARAFVPVGLPTGPQLARHASTPLRRSYVAATALGDCMATAEGLQQMAACSGSYAAGIPAEPFFIPALVVTAIGGVSVVTLAASFIFLSRIKELKVATAVAELGLLTQAEELGVFSKLESVGAFSLAEKALPIIENLKILSLTDKGLALVRPALDAWDDNQATQEVRKPRAGRRPHVQPARPYITPTALPSNPAASLHQVERAASKAVEKVELAEKTRRKAIQKKQNAADASRLLASYSFDAKGSLVNSPAIAKSRK